MQNKRIKISLIFNLIIVAMVTASLAILYTGFIFMPGYETIVETSKLGMIKFFTIQSNIFVGLAALVLAVSEIKYLRGKTSHIAKSSYILKFMGTSAVGLTFLVVFAYLGPITKGGIPSMIKNSNLFLHCLTPIVSILSFTMFDKTKELKLKNVVYGVIPTALYGVYYMANIIIHMENGKVKPLYDWYWFVQNGVWTAIIVVPMILGISYIISLIIWKLNRIKS